MELETELYREAIARIVSLACYDVQQILREAGPTALRFHHEQGLQLRGTLPADLRNRLTHYGEHLAFIAAQIAPVQQIILEAPGLRNRSLPSGWTRHSD